MKVLIVVLTIFCFSFELCSQPNCELLKDNTDCYNSCEKAWKAIRYKQGSFKSQELFNQSIDLCPSFAYSYMEKGVPYLKRGHFVEWKKLIDRAVQLSPIEYLGYRGWCRLQFLRDYIGAIEDIEELKRIMIYDVGYCQNGNYHLEVALGLCYKELGELERAKTIIHTHLKTYKSSPGLYDYYHIGVIEYELGNYEQAIELLEKQLDYYELAEVYFYLALANKQVNRMDEYFIALDKSEQLYLNSISMYDNYTEPIDKIYLSDIQKEKAQNLTGDKSNK